jgi:non-ribosomal peptide synthetase component F
MSFLIPLTIGGSFYIIDKHKVKPIAIYEVLESKKITFALMVPSVIKTLEPYLRNETINGLKYSQFCGETLTVSQVESWQNICPNTQIDNVYGPTEATIYCTRYRVVKNRPIHHYKGIVSIGKPMYGTTLNVINDELLIGGGQVTSGYINEILNTTSFALIDNMRFYKSGDLAVLNDTEFYCLGRLDRQVKIQGFRVELSEIEYTFGLLFPNHESVAIYVDFKNQGRIILCVLAHHSPLDINNIIAQLREKLPAYMVPEQIQIWGKWPLNSNGKIDIKQLSNEILNKTG